MKMTSLMRTRLVHRLQERWWRLTQEAKQREAGAMLVGRETWVKTRDRYAQQIEGIDAQIEQIRGLDPYQSVDVTVIADWIEAADTSWSYVMGEIDVCYGPAYRWAENARRKEARRCNDICDRLAHRIRMYETGDMRCGRCRDKK